MTALIGALLIIAGFGFEGNRRSFVMISRVRELRQLIDSFQWITNEIYERQAPILGLIKKQAEKNRTTAPFFQTLYEHLQQEADGMEEAVQRALDTVDHTLTDEECEWLKKTGQALSRLERETIQSDMSLILDELRDCEREARERAMKMGKVLRTSGWLCGSLFVLLLL